MKVRAGLPQIWKSCRFLCEMRNHVNFSLRSLKYNVQASTSDAKQIAGIWGSWSPNIIFVRKIFDPMFFDQPRIGGNHRLFPNHRLFSNVFCDLRYSSVLLAWLWSLNWLRHVVCIFFKFSISAFHMFNVACFHPCEICIIVDGKIWISTDWHRNFADLIFV